VVVDQEFEDEVRTLMSAEDRREWLAE